MIAPQKQTVSLAEKAIGLGSSGSEESAELRFIQLPDTDDWGASA